MYNNVWKICKGRPLYYLKHPIEWCKDFALSVKWARQRAKRGFAEIDWFNLCDWMIGVLAPMFEEYAANCYGYPGENRGWTHEKWVEYLKEIAAHFRNASEEQTAQVNEYLDDYDALSDEHWNRAEKSVNDKGDITHKWQEPTDEQRALIHKYFKREAEIEEWKQTEAQTALRMIGDMFFDLWD